MSLAPARRLAIGRHLAVNFHSQATTSASHDSQLSRLGVIGASTRDCLARVPFQCRCVDDSGVYRARDCQHHARERRPREDWVLGTGFGRYGERGSCGPRGRDRSTAVAPLLRDQAHALAGTSWSSSANAVAAGVPPPVARASRHGAIARRAATAELQRQRYSLRPGVGDLPGGGCHTLPVHYFCSSFGVSSQ